MATYTIRVKGGPSFPCPDHKPILFAAWEQGVPLPYSCRVGGCGTCVALVINGRVDHSRELITDLPGTKRNDGAEPVGVPAQLCKAYPLSDCTILAPSREAQSGSLPTASRAIDTREGANRNTVSPSRSDCPSMA